MWTDDKKRVCLGEDTFLNDPNPFKPRSLDDAEECFGKCVILLTKVIHDRIFLEPLHVMGSGMSRNLVGFLKYQPNKSIVQLLLQAKPAINPNSRTVDIFHPGDLTRLFIGVILVDTYCVCPELWRLSRPSFVGEVATFHPLPELSEGME